MLKNLLKFFFKNKLISIILFLATATNIAIWINLLRIKPTDKLIPLHYNIYFGIDYLGKWHQIFTLPAAGFMILSINFILALFIYFKDRLIAYILIFASFLIQIILFLASMAIVWINI